MRIFDLFREIGKRRIKVDRDGIREDFSTEHKLAMQKAANAVAASRALAIGTVSEVAAQAKERIKLVEDAIAGPVTSSAIVELVSKDDQPGAVLSVVLDEAAAEALIADIDPSIMDETAEIDPSEVEMANAIIGDDAA